jgi:hypothetical protein
MSVLAERLLQTAHHTSDNASVIMVRVVEAA